MIAFVIFGMLFGFALSRTGATHFDAIHSMFLLQDLHLVGVIAVAISLSALGYALFRAGTLRVRGGGAPNLKQKPMQRGLIAGAFLFGAGWALTGTCPGTALAQIGEGTLAGFVTFAGILIGTRLAERSATRGDRLARLVLRNHLGLVPSSRNVDALLEGEAVATDVPVVRGPPLHRDTPIRNGAGPIR